MSSTGDIWLLKLELEPDVAKRRSGGGGGTLGPKVAQADAVAASNLSAVAASPAAPELRRRACVARLDAAAWPLAAATRAALAAGEGPEGGERGEGGEGGGVRGESSSSKLGSEREGRRMLRESLPERRSEDDGVAGRTCVGGVPAPQRRARRLRFIACSRPCREKLFPPLPPRSGVTRVWQPCCLAAW